MVHSLKYVNLYFVFCEYSRHQTEILVYCAELVRHNKTSGTIIMCWEKTQGTLLYVFCYFIERVNELVMEYGGQEVRKLHFTNKTKKCPMRGCSETGLTLHIRVAYSAINWFQRSEMF